MFSRASSVSQPLPTISRKKVLGEEERILRKISRMSQTEKEDLVLSFVVGYAGSPKPRRRTRKSSRRSSMSSSSSISSSSSCCSSCCSLWSPQPSMRHQQPESYLRIRSSLRLIWANNNENKNIIVHPTTKHPAITSDDWFMLRYLHRPPRFISWLPGRVVDTLPYTSKCTIG